uniref:histidine kinase n=1 Tax=Archaeoglobus fulgidus TaxID=2234 RepID=A0A7C3MEP2_ARCFL
MPESRDSNCFKYGEKYTLKLSRSGKILDADREFVEKIGYDLDSILSATIFDLVERSDVIEKLEEGGEVEVIGVDGNSYTMHLYNAGDFIYAYDIGIFYQILREMYAGVWDFYYGLIFVDESRRILAANDTFYKFTGMGRIEGSKVEEQFPEIYHFDEILKKGEGEVILKINNRTFQVRLKVREIRVLGKKIYEILARTLTEEKVRGLKAIFDDIRYPVIAFFADEVIYYNNAARKLVSELEFESVRGRKLGSVKVGDKRYLFFKFGEDNVYIFVEDLEKVLKAVKEELLKYRLSFETSVDAIIIIDRDGTILHANPAVRLHGYTPEELIGRNVFEFIHPDQLDTVERTIEEGKRGSFGRVEVIIRDKWGNPRWVEVVGVPVKSPSGEVTGGILVLRDTTTRKELERKLLESEELYRTLTENSPSGIYVIQDGELIYMNRATENYFGYTVEELRNDWKKVFDREIWDNVDKAINETLSGKIVRTFARYYTKDGKKKYASFVLTPITFRGKKAVLGNFIDVTDAVMAEKKLREREELYRTLAENSHTGIFIIQNDKIVYGNEKLRKMLGYTIEEINALEHPYKVVHPDFYRLALERYRARERGENVPESYEVKVITKDGKEKWLKVLATRIHYKGKPAVMANVADITDLKDREFMLRRLNLLLRVTGDCSREISQEKNESRIISTIKKHLEEAGLKVAIYVYGNVLMPAGISGGLDEKECEKLAAKYVNSDEMRLERVGDLDALIMPLSNGIFPGIILLFSDRKFTDEEVSILSSLWRDINYVLKSLKVEKEKETAMKVIMENLSHFENLADKLRNPLAIIKGYLEIRENFSYDDFARKIEEQASRIEAILDELREREIVTYEIKKSLEG